jgi:hypothetical protein
MCTLKASDDVAVSDGIHELGFLNGMIAVLLFHRRVATVAVRRAGREACCSERGSSVVALLQAQHRQRHEQ